MEWVVSGSAGEGWSMPLLSKAKKEVRRRIQGPKNRSMSERSKEGKNWAISTLRECDDSNLPRGTMREKRVEGPVSISSVLAGNLLEGQYRSPFV